MTVALNLDLAAPVPQTHDGTGTGTRMLDAERSKPPMHGRIRRRKPCNTIVSADGWNVALAAGLTPTLNQATHDLLSPTSNRRRIANGAIISPAEFLNLCILLRIVFYTSYSWS